MNIYTQVCGLIILLLILWAYQRQPSMELISEKRFRAVLYVALCCVLLDIASCYVIAHSADFSDLFLKIVCKLYLASLCAVSFSTLRYTICDVMDSLGKDALRIPKIFFRASYCIGLFLIFYLPVNYYYDESGLLYSYGPSALATYFFALFYVIAVMTETLFLHRKYIKSKRRGAIISWMVIWCIAAIIQFLFPKILIVSFAICAGMLITYFEIENPEATISRKTGHFSSSVLREYFDYLYKNKKQFSVMQISFRTVAESNEETALLRQTINLLSEFLFTIKNAKIFDTAEGYFILIFEDASYMESTKDKINAYFQSVEDNPNVEAAITLLNPYFIMVPSSHLAVNAEELMSVLTGYWPSNYNNVSKDEVVIDDAIMYEIRNRKSVENLIVDSLKNDRVAVYYQPIYNVAKKSFTSAEALVRIKLSTGKIISPGEFIPIAEQTGRIVPLSDAIYKKALSFVKLYKLNNLGVDYIELNLSVKQGENPLFASRFTDLLKEMNLPANMINLEITETSSIQSKENLLTNMKKLEKVGVHFSLDDFGSGSSNMNYIIDMPVNIIKLDKNLTDAYFVNEKANAVVSAVIKMAHSLGLKIVAEGIETKDALDTMVELGVDYIQGYYFSPPLPERDYLAFLQKNNLNN